MDREIAPTKNKKRILYGSVGVVSVILALLLLNVIVRSLLKSASVKSSDIEIATVQKGELEGSFTVDGTVTPLTVYQVESSLGGKIEHILCKVGDRVQAGDPLVSMSNDDLQLSLIEQEASVTDQVNNLNDARILANQSRLSQKREIAAARNTLAQARRLYNTQKGLFTKHYVSQEDLDVAREQFEYSQTNFDCLVEEAKTDSLFRLQQIAQQEQAVDRIRLSLDQVRARISSLNVKAPISGVITEMELTTGQMISSGSRIAVIEDSTKYYIRAEVDQFYLSRLKEGCAARFTDNRGEHALKIIKVHPKLSGDKAVVDLDGELPTTLRSGQTLSVDIISSTLHDVLKLPLGPYLNDTSGNWVFAMPVGSHRAERRTVSLGFRSSREVEVVSGLQPGDEVIVSSYQEWMKKKVIRIH
jgi:HlyD family secretion protein